MYNSFPSQLPSLEFMFQFFSLTKQYYLNRSLNVKGYNSGFDVKKNLHSVHRFSK